MLDGDIQVNHQDDTADVDLTYGTAAQVGVICNDKNLVDGSEEITLYSVDATGKKTKIETVKADAHDFGILNVGKYYVEATGENEATDKNDRQLIEGMYFDVVPADLDANDDAKIEVNPKNNQQVVLSGIDVKDLPKESFTVYQNSSKLPQDQDKYDFYYDEEDGTYNFIIKAGASVTDDIKIVVSAKNYAELSVHHAPEAAPTTDVDVTLTGSADADANTITLNVSSNVDADARAMLASTDVWKVVKTDAVAGNASISVNKIEVNAGGTITLSTADLYKTAPYRVSLDMTLNGVHYTGTVDVVGA